MLAFSSWSQSRCSLWKHYERCPSIQKYRPACVALEGLQSTFFLRESDILITDSLWGTFTVIWGRSDNFLILLNGWALSPPASIVWEGVGTHQENSCLWWFVRSHESRTITNFSGHQTESFSNFQKCAEKTFNALWVHFQLLWAPSCCPTLVAEARSRLRRQQHGFKRFLGTHEPLLWTKQTAPKTTLVHWQIANCVVIWIAIHNPMNQSVRHP